MWRNIYQELEDKLQALADEFGRSLGDFINGLRLDRAHSWEALLYGFLHDWRQRGILVEDSERQKLYKLLGELRAELVPAEDLQAAMDCWKRQAADALSRSGPPELGEPGSAEEAALPAGVRQLGQGIMRRHPPENWLRVVQDVLASWRFVEDVAVKFKAWMAAEHDSKFADANSTTQPNVESALEDAATARLRSLGEAIMQQYPPERWLVEAQNRIQALPTSEQTKHQFLEWVEAEQYWRLLPKQVAQGAGHEPDPSASAAFQAEFKAGFIEGFTDGMQQSAATVGYLAGLLVRVQIASNTFASLAYAAIFNGAPLEAELRLMSDVGMFGADLSKGSNWQFSILTTMGSAAVLAQLEKAQQALATIKPVLDLVRSAVSDQDPRAQGKIVGWAAYQAVESALTVGAAELAKSETLALVYRRLLASPAIRANEALEEALRAALEKLATRRAPRIAAPSNVLVPTGEVGSYSTKIKWGIQNVEARPAGPGYWGKRTPQANPAVEAYELKINPNNESYYLPHPEGGFVQFENVVEATVQDGKLVQTARSFYKPSALGDKMQPIAESKVLAEARRQVQAASSQGMQVEWLVPDEAAVAELRSLFESKGINVKVTHFPK